MKFLAMFLTLFGVVAWAQAEFTAATLPQTEQMIVLDGSELYLSVQYYSWGENWSGVKSQKTGKVAGNSYQFTINDAPSKGGKYAINGQWSQSNPKNVVFDATMSVEAATKLQLSQFLLKLGSKFASQKATLVLNGKKDERKLPFQRAQKGTPVDSIIFTDSTGAKTVIEFGKTVELFFDGEIRMVIAKDAIEAGSTHNLSFTIKLPENVAFYAGEKGVTAESKGWYAFNGKNTTSPQSELNLSSWLEKPAGKHGRISRNGANIVYNNKPIKLWGVNVTYANCAPEKKVADQRAAFYAAMGINSVRLHKYADGAGWAGILSKESAAKYDATMLDRMDYFIAALKKEGIYTKLSPVFILDIGPEDMARFPYIKEFGTQLKNNRIDPKHGSYYFSSELQELLIEQVITLLKHKNPYTNTTYAEENAIAYLEIYNEDSIFWYGTNTMLQKTPTLRKRAGGMFAEWLVKKYQTEANLLKAWGKNSLNSNLLKANKFPTDEVWGKQIYPFGSPYFFDPTALATSQRMYKARLLDTMQFLYDTQNAVYAKYIKAVRDAGYKGDIVTSNWQAGRMMSHFYNLKSDLVGGIIDRHNYFGGMRGSVGFFNSMSMITNPGSGNISASLQQVDNYPFMLSEWIHVFPNEWGVEGISIIGTYGMGFQGWDASYVFEMNKSTKEAYSSALGSSKWDGAAPHVLGVFPAVSRQVLRGDVQESKTVHYRNVDMTSLEKGELGFDENVTHSADTKSFNSKEFPHQALAAVKGLVRFTDEPTPTKAFNLNEYMKDGAIVSDTKELSWFAGKSTRDGYFQIDTPATQAIVGFAKGKKADLTDVVIEVKSDFGAIYFSAKERDKTIASDKKVIITAIGRARNQGAKYLADTILISKGEMSGRNAKGPVLLEGVSAKITLKNSPKVKVFLLDHNGVKTAKLLPNSRGEFEIDTNRDKTPFYLIEK